jgi:DNA-binding beta-propeller fold protein YncE
LLDMAAASPSPALGPLVGQGEFQYQPVIGWEQLPDGWSFGEAVGVATDSAGNVFVFSRGEHPITVFDRSGKFLRSWGEGLCTRPHGITIGPDDSVYLVDDFGHSLRKCSPDGKLLMTLGTPDQGSNTGAQGLDYRTIQRIAGPFNAPTNVAIADNGELFVADGYGNARIHRFSPTGELLHSWGEPGSGPGQFYVPHGIGFDRDGTLLICDRENHRLVRYSTEGKFLEEWTGIARPCEVAVDPDGNVFIAELGYRAGMYPGNEPPPGQTTGGRVSIYSSDKRLLSRFGGGDTPCAPGDFFATHDITIDRFGDVYVGEVTLSAGGNWGVVPKDCHSLQKLVRVK